MYKMFNIIIIIIIVNFIFALTRVSGEQGEL